MALTLKQSAAIGPLSEFLADFLPGKPHPYADQSVSFAGVASRLKLAAFWAGGGSKRPSVQRLLERTLDEDAKRFCTLVLEVTRVGIGYRQSKQPITRADIETLDSLVRAVGFGIKELRDPAFLASLPATPANPKAAQAPLPADKSISSESLATLRSQIREISDLAPQARGFKFEKFLDALFAEHGLSPRASFRLKGEQIDGSFELAAQHYLVEAKWQAKRSAEDELLVFSGKISGKAQWSRGVFISYSGFSADGLEAFSRGKPTNLVCVDRNDLLFVLSGKASLQEVLRRKVRRAAEENLAFAPCDKLFP